MDETVRESEIFRLRSNAYLVAVALLLTLGFTLFPPGDPTHVLLPLFGGEAVWLAFYAVSRSKGPNTRGCRKHGHIADPIDFSVPVCAPTGWVMIAAGAAIAACSVWRLATADNAALGFIVGMVLEAGIGADLLSAGFRLRWPLLTHFQQMANVEMLRPPTSPRC